MRIVGLIGWLGTRATGHLPFLGGVYCALYWGRSDWLKVTPRLWISLLTAALTMIPPFSVPRDLMSDWKLVKWLFVDAQPSGCLVVLSGSVLAYMTLLGGR